MNLNKLNELLRRDGETAYRLPYYILLSNIPPQSKIELEVSNFNNPISLLETRCGYFLEIVGYGLPDYLKAIKYDTKGGIRLAFIDSIVSLRIENLPNFCKFA